MKGILKVCFVIFLVFFLVSLALAQGKYPVADARVGFSPDDVTQKYIYTTVNERIYFDGSRSFDQDLTGSIKGYYWNFGDGFTEIGMAVEHQYSSLGDYTVKLMVLDNENFPSLVPSEVEVFITSGLEAEIKFPKREEFIRDVKHKVRFLGEGKGGIPCYEVPHYHYEWNSDVVGVIGNEPEFYLPATLPYGWHHITLKVVDCLGNSAIDEVDIAIAKPLKAKITESCEETFTGETITLGRVVFDSSWLRFIPWPPYSQGYDSCDNSRYISNVAKWLDQNGKILIYTSGEVDRIEKLKIFLEGEDYSVDVVSRMNEKITSSLLSGYGQVWFLDTEKETTLEREEIGAVRKYHEEKGNILLSGEANESSACWAVMLNDISEEWDVEMNKKLGVSLDGNNCVAPDFITHPLMEGVTHLSSSGDDVLINSFNPQAGVIGRISGKPYILALDYETISIGTKSYLCDCEVGLIGGVSGGIPPYEVKWISLEDGVIDRYWIKEDKGTYSLRRPAPMLAPLSNGTHSIKFEVTDSLGITDSDTRYEVHVRWCCAFGTDCETYWPQGEGPIVDTGNEESHSCDIYEVCHPDLWPLAREAIECCKWKCSEDCHDSCGIGYGYGAELGETPEGLTLDGLKRCAALYLIYGLGKEARYMSDYFWPEICCTGNPYCLKECCQADLGKCRCVYHVYTKNQQALPCGGSVSNSPRGWSSDTAMNKNSCTFSDLSAHMSILGDEGIATEASGINTGTCCDYSTALTTLVRMIGYRSDEIYSVTGPKHCFNLIHLPGEEKWNFVDTTGNKKTPWVKKGVPPDYNYHSYFINTCRNDEGLFTCPTNVY